MKFYIFQINGIEIECFNNTPLIIAVNECHKEIVQLLISHSNIDINCKNI